MARGMPGHKKHCRCVACKAMRKRGRKGGGGGRAHAVSSKGHLKKLRRELGQAKRGAAKASSNGDASSWSRFNATVGRLERAIAAHRRR